MARFFGNIWGQALGSVGGTTFSLARDRQGKVQTARQRVIPHNPRSPEQVASRANIADSTRIARVFNNQYSFSAFDYGISKLPGYQSIVSILTKAKSYSNGVLTFSNVDYHIPREYGSQAHLTFREHSGGSEYSFRANVLGDSLPAGFQLNLLAMPLKTTTNPPATYRAEAFHFPTWQNQLLFFDLGGFEVEGSGAFCIFFFSRPGAYDRTQISNITFETIFP